MDIILVFAVAILLGALVNVLADDLPAGRLPKRPRYPDGAPRPLLAWLAIGAFLFNLRHSPKSNATDNDRKLTWRYPLTELALATLLVITHLVKRDDPHLATGQLIIWQAYVVVFVLLSVVDLEHKHILIMPVILASALALINAAAFPQPAPNLPSSLVGGTVGGLTFSLVFWGGRLVGRFFGRRRKMPTAFGKGDVYLMILAGLIVGFPHVLAVMILAIFLGGFGALACIFQMILSRRYELFTAFPYGPYILAAVYIVLIVSSKIVLWL